MHITVKWFGDQFNINLHVKEDVEEFLSIKGCRILEHNSKPFIAFPAQKNEKTGKWWNHVWANEKFQAAVIELARKEKQLAKDPKDVSDIDSDIPF
jgi:hypothetical protein